MHDVYLTSVMQVLTSLWGDLHPLSYDYLYVAHSQVSDDDICTFKVNLHVLCEEFVPDGPYLCNSVCREETIVGNPRTADILKERSVKLLQIACYADIS